MPRFSIIVPAYNATRTLGETLDAVLAQEYADWECVVVDDGSTDGTADLIRRYAELDSRVRLVSQSNKGTAGANRTGVEHAEADLLVICAADDLLYPQHLASMDELITRNPGYDIYSSNGEFLYHETGERRTVYTAEDLQAERSLTFEDLVQWCFYSVGAVYRRSAYELAGGYRLGVYVDDYDLWLRAMARGATQLYSPKVLSAHRVSSFQQTANLQRVFEANIEAYRYLLKHGFVSGNRKRAVKASIETNYRQIDAMMGDPSRAVRKGDAGYRIRRAIAVSAARVARGLMGAARLTRPLRHRGGQSAE